MADYCAHYDIVHYLPLRRETKKYQRRNVTVEKPVFPGYVFAAPAASQVPIIRKSCSMVRAIDIEDQGRFLRELEQVRKALAVDPTLGARAAFTQGRPVRINSGPFAGIEGVVTTVRNEMLVVLNVQMIGQSVAVVVETDALEPLEA